MRKALFGALLAGLMYSQTVLAGGLFRTTRLDVSIGMTERSMMSTKVTAAGRDLVSYSGQGVTANVGIGKHISGSIWGEIALGVQALEARNEVSWWGTETHAVALMPIMIGLRTYPFASLDTGFQPFLGIRGGAVIGAESTQKVGPVVITESHSETTLGYYLNAGVDMLLLSWLGVEVSGGYLFMSDFETPLNSTHNFNGWDASLGVSLFLGSQ